MDQPVGQWSRRLPSDGRKVSELIQRLPDKRSGRVVFLSHCLLNQNVRYLGGATRAGAVDEIVDRFQREGVGFCQMACPEQLAWGGVLKRHTLRLYGSRGSLRYRLRRLLARIFIAYTQLRYRTLAVSVARQIADYRSAGFDVVGIVGIGGSPSCGVKTTMDIGRVVESVAGCELNQFTTEGFNQGVVLRNRQTGKGLFIQSLQRQLARQQGTIPFLEHDLTDELLDGAAGVTASRSIATQPIR